jgi:hypothetical protein
LELRELIANGLTFVFIFNRCRLRSSSFTINSVYAVLWSVLRWVFALVLIRPISCFPQGFRSSPRT